MFARPRRSLAAPLGQQRVYQFVRVWFRLGGSFSSTSFSLTAAAVGPGQAMNFAVNEGLNGNLNYGISTVSIVPTKSLGSTQLTVVTPGRPWHPPSPADRSQASSREPVGVNPSSISQGTITFQLSGAWMTAHSLTPADIVLLRDVNGQWTELPTTFASQSGNTYTFTAITRASGTSQSPGGSQQGHRRSNNYAGAPVLGAGAATPAVPTTPFLYPATPRQTTAVPVAMQPVTSKVAATAPALARVLALPYRGGNCRDRPDRHGRAPGRRWWIRRQNPYCSGNTINLFFSGRSHLTYGDTVKHVNGGSALIEQWLKNKNTVPFLGMWEQIKYPDFNSPGFEGMRNVAGRNSFSLSREDVDRCNGCMGIRMGQVRGWPVLRDRCFRRYHRSYTFLLGPTFRTETNNSASSILRRTRYAPTR